MADGPRAIGAGIKRQIILRIGDGIARRPVANFQIDHLFGRAVEQLMAQGAAGFKTDTIPRRP